MACGFAVDTEREGQVLEVLVQPKPAALTLMRKRSDHFLGSGQPDRGLSATNPAKKKWRVRTPCLFPVPGFAEPDGPFLRFRSE